MTNISETVKTGAAAGRRVADKSPLALLARLRDKDPTGGYETIKRKWCRDIHADDAYEAAADEYLYRLLWSQLDTAKRQKEQAQAVATTTTVEQKQEQAAALDQKIESRASKIAGVVLMGLTLPTGKLLKDSTFAECARAGGFFLRIAKLGKAKQIVGQTVTEVQLQKAL